MAISRAFTGVHSVSKEDAIHNDLIEVLFKLGAIKQKIRGDAKRGPKFTSIFKPGAYGAVNVETEVEIIEPIMHIDVKLTIAEIVEDE